MILITQLLPLIAIIAFGYSLCRIKLLSAARLSQLSRLTFTWLIPLLLFYHMANAKFASLMKPSLYLSFYGSVITVYLLTFLLNKWRNNADNIAAIAAVNSLGATYSNTIIIGLPVLTATLGETVAPIIFMTISFHSALLFIGTTVLANWSRGKATNAFTLIKSTLVNPLIVGIFAGLVTNMLGIDLPTIINQILAYNGKIAVPLALLVLGGSLSQYRLVKQSAELLWLSTIKLLILPALTWLIAQFIFQLPAFETLVLVILTACPTGVNAYLVACQQKQQQETVAALVVLTTLLSAITIPLWLLWLN